MVVGDGCWGREVKWAAPREYGVFAPFLTLHFRLVHLRIVPADGDLLT